MTVSPGWALATMNAIVWHGADALQGLALLPCGRDTYSVFAPAAAAVEPATAVTAAPIN